MGSYFGFPFFVHGGSHGVVSFYSNIYYGFFLRNNFHFHGISMNKLFIRVVNRYCTFKFLLSYIDTDINDIGKCFCPFHENTDTPAAKIYKNDDGESLYCFAESRMYRPADLLIRNIVPFTVDHVGGLIWDKLSESERSQFDTEGVKVVSKYDKSIFELFKSGSITYKELVDRIENS